MMEAPTDTHTAENSFVTRLNAFADLMPDWSEVMESAAMNTAPLSPHVQRYIQQAEAGPALLYLLAKYPGAIPEIDVMPPDRAQMAIDQLVRDCTPYAPLDPAHLFDVGAAMMECIDRHRLFRWIPRGKSH